MEQMRALWRRAFCDTKKYIDYYFAKKAPISRAYKSDEAGELASMMFFTPYDICYKGKKITAEYIVGVATEEKYRRQGRMKKLMRRALREENKRGIDVVFLCPENPKVYESLGFVPTYWRETTHYETDKKIREATTFAAKAWKELDDREQIVACAFIEEMLKKEKFEAYICHTKDYMDRVDEELHALDGEVVSVWDNGEIAAVANTICEENEQIITELICRPHMGAEVLECILKRKEAACVMVEDSHFIADLEGDNAKRIKRKNPYIMACYTDEKKMQPVRCYINDIT